jgi:hypothetical protein
LPNDYDAFRRFSGPDVPDTFEKWSKMIADRRREESLRGADVRDMDVNPHEFARYCNATGQSYNLAILRHFVEAKACGQRY